MPTIRKDEGRNTAQDQHRHDAKDSSAFGEGGQHEDAIADTDACSDTFPNATPVTTAATHLHESRLLENPRVDVSQVIKQRLLRSRNQGSNERQIVQWLPVHTGSGPRAKTVPFN